MGAQTVVSSILPVRRKSLRRTGLMRWVNVGGSGTAMSAIGFAFKWLKNLFESQDFLKVDPPGQIGQKYCCKEAGQHGEETLKVEMKREGENDQQPYEKVVILKGQHPTKGRSMVWKGVTNQQNRLSEITSGISTKVKERKNFPCLCGEISTACCLSIIHDLGSCILWWKDDHTHLFRINEGLCSPWCCSNTSSHNWSAATDRQEAC